MKKLLRIDCSSRITGSHSRELADYFEKKWTIANPDGIVIRRDLAKEQLPHIQNNTIEGFYTPDEYSTPEIKEATALSTALISELKSVDEVLINSPLYNLNVPSNLKAYLDQIVRIGHTFNTNESGYYGLLNNKTAYLITAKGGLYKGSPMEQHDFQEPYLQAILGHMGIKNQYLFSLEGTSDNKIVEQNKLILQNRIIKSMMKKNKESYFEDDLKNNAIVINPNEGEKIELDTISITFKVTSEISNEQLGIYEIILPPMAIGAKLHYHRFMDETFIVNEGVLTLQVSDKEYQVKPGTVAYAPRFTPHGFKNDTNKIVKLLIIFNPSQKREGFFRGLYDTLNETPIDPEKYLQLYNKYDSFPVDTSNMIPVRD